MHIKDEKNMNEIYRNEGVIWTSGTNTSDCQKKGLKSWVGTNNFLEIFERESGDLQKH
jgi:hypothetical protein